MGISTRRSTRLVGLVGQGPSNPPLAHAVDDGDQVQVGATFNRTPKKMSGFGSLLDSELAARLVSVQADWASRVAIEFETRRAHLRRNRIRHDGLG